MNICEGHGQQPHGGCYRRRGCGRGRGAEGLISVSFDSICPRSIPGVGVLDGNKRKNHKKARNRQKTLDKTIRMLYTNKCIRKTADTSRDASVSYSRYASVAQLVEQGTENPRVIGSIPIGGTIFAGVAHLVERHLAKVEVASSSLVFRSNRTQKFGSCFCFQGQNMRKKRSFLGIFPGNDLFF